jgi:peptidoglycan/xylan/chitin deacetylase (PgdA/CDA1 family)
MRMGGRSWSRLGALVSVVALALLVPGVARAQSAPITAVSLTFDDGDADQSIAASILAQHELRGTFYIITGAVGSPGYLTLSDVRRLAAAGNEIGGHTVSHLDLTRVALLEARRQVCASRAILTGWGFQVTSFAYPDGSQNPAVRRIVQECGYNSGRLDGGLRSPTCDDCAAAGPFQPTDAEGVETPDQVDNTWTLADLQYSVTAAEQTGGWVPLVFHHICDTPVCGPLSVRASTLREFTDWLADRSHLGTQVETVDQVVGGPVRAVAPVAPVAPHGVVNGSLETLGAYDADESDLGSSTAHPTVPRCWTESGYGKNTAQWTRVPGGHRSRFAEQVTVTAHSSGDTKLLPRFDLGQCAPPATPGSAYQLTAWYHGTVRTQYSVYYRTPQGRWVYWTSSPFFAPASTWTQASWRTPALPADGSALSFGLAVADVGTLTTDDYAIQAEPPVAPPAPQDPQSGSGMSLTTALLISGAVVVFLVYFVRVRPRMRRERRRQMALRSGSSRRR